MSRSLRNERTLGALTVHATEIGECPVQGLLEFHLKSKGGSLRASTSQALDWGEGADVEVAAGDPSRGRKKKKDEIFTHLFNP